MPAEQTASTEQASTVFYSEMLKLDPVAYWRLGEMSGQVAYDSQRYGMNGNWVGGLIYAPGALWTDSDRSGLFDPVNSMNYITVPNYRRLSFNQAWDTFNRGTAFCTLGSSWGTSPAGDGWSAQVSTGSYYCTDGVKARINPQGRAGTWQQGINVSQLDGDEQVRAAWGVHASGGALAPVSLVARRVDANNYVRAELSENPDHTLDLLIIKASGGTSQILARLNNVGTYNLGDYWYLRFQFDGGTIRAKAWVMDMYHHTSPSRSGFGCNSDCRISYEPTSWQVTATDASPQPGGVGIRYTNSLGTARPVVSYDDFWLQTVGFTIHAFGLATYTTFPGYNNSGDSQVLGKGTQNGTDDHQEEYEMRFMSDNSTYSSDWNRWKMYIFNNEGGLGAGVAYTPVAKLTWYEFVFEFDPGDYLDTTANVRMFVNGVPEGLTGLCSGANYSGLCDKDDKGNPIPNWMANPEWQIVPGRGNKSFRMGTMDTSSLFWGRLDEVAIFDRKLTPTEVQQLHVASQQ